MAVVATDIKFFLSGGNTNTAPNASLGGVISSTEIDNDTLNNLFDSVTGAESTSGTVEYRCFYVMNTNGADTLSAVKTWISANTPSTFTSVDIGIDPAGVGDGVTTGVATTVANETTAPAGVTFSAAANEAAALEPGTFDAGEGVAIWMRRTVTAGASAYNGDSASVIVKGSP